MTFIWPWPIQLTFRSKHVHIIMHGALVHVLFDLHLTLTSTTHLQESACTYHNAWCPCSRLVWPSSDIDLYNSPSGVSMYISQCMVPLFTSHLTFIWPWPLQLTFRSQHVHITVHGALVYVSFDLDLYNSPSGVSMYISQCMVPLSTSLLTFSLLYPPYIMTLYWSCRDAIIKPDRGGGGFPLASIFVHVYVSTLKICTSLKYL